MTGTLRSGHRAWKMTRDEEGHREYSIRSLVKCSSYLDGPAVVSQTAGLFAVGSTWSVDNDTDSWAFCIPKMTISPVLEDEKNTEWYVDQIFTTRPLRRCQDTAIEDPLNEPARIGGSFVKYTEEAAYDRNGDAIINSSYEQIRGQEVERDRNRPTVWVEINRSTLPLATVTALMDYVNDSTMWGLAARCIKLSAFTWERKLYGSCSYYYTLRYEFDINFDTFDRDLLDKGTKILMPGGTAGNLAHYQVYQESATDTPVEVILDGAGNPWDSTGMTPPGNIHVELYPEANLLSTLPGLPSSLT